MNPTLPPERRPPGTADAPATAGGPGPAASPPGATPAPARVYAVLVLMLVLSGLDQTILSTALPRIVAELQGAELGSWVFSAYLMACTAVIPLYGKLADRFGVQRLLLLATALFATGSLGCAAATSMPALVAARTLQGLGGGGLMTLTMLAVVALFPLDERPRRMALLGAAYGLSTVVGPLTGGLLLEVVSWHWTFLLNLPGALLALAMLARWQAPQRAAPAHRLDGAGALLLVGALVALLLATRGAGRAAVAVTAGPVDTRLAAALAVVLLAAWFVVERRAEDPVVPLDLFRIKPFAAAAGLSALSGVALFAAVVFLPIHLQQGQGLGALRSALHTMPLMLGILVAVRISSRALRAGRTLRLVSAVSAAAVTLGYGLLAAALHAAPASTFLLAAALLPVGLGLGLMFPLVTVVAQRFAPPRHIGIATAMPLMLRALGGALGVAALGEVLRRHMAQGAAAGWHSRAEAAQALAGGVAELCLWAALAGVGALLVSRALPLRPPRAPTPQAVASTS